eukprot:2284930-Prymnesium_polylepis.1
MFSSACGRPRHPGGGVCRERVPPLQVRAHVHAQDRPPPDPALCQRADRAVEDGRSRLLLGLLPAGLAIDLRRARVAQGLPDASHHAGDAP